MTYVLNQSKGINNRKGESKGREIRRGEMMWNVDVKNEKIWELKSVNWSDEYQFMSLKKSYSTQLGAQMEAEVWYSILNVYVRIWWEISTYKTSI